jgi:hypothetical protein
MASSMEQAGPTWCPATSAPACRCPPGQRPRQSPLYSRAVRRRGPVVEGRHLGLERGSGGLVSVRNHELQDTGGQGQRGGPARVQRRCWPLGSHCALGGHGRALRTQPVLRQESPVPRKQREQDVEGAP